MLETEALQPHSDVETLARILARTASLLQARGCGVFIWDRDKHTLSAMRPFHGVPEERVRGLDYPLGTSSLGACVQQDRPTLFQRGTDNGADAALLEALAVDNLVAVPLALERRDEDNEVVERQIMGALCAGDKFYGRSFDMEDARLLSMMARQASAVLVTSQLYWKEVERTKRVLAIVESTSVGLMAVSPRGTVTQVNAAARRALGIEGDVWFGRPYAELIDSHDICAIIREALHDNPPEAPKELSLQVRLADGNEEERIYRVQIDQIRAEDRQSMGWVIVFEDVTDIRQAERMMAVFVDMVSHELRTPLTSIRGFVATLLQAGEGTFDWETQEEFLQIVDTEAERLGQMIDDLLNIARIQNGRGLQFHFVATDLQQIINGVIRLQKHSSSMKGQHKLALDLAPDLPQIMADDAKLQQILHNLVGNALKYSPNGGEVAIGARPVDGGILISVRDQGIGIPKEQLPRMFGQFYRVESSSHTGIKGTGLGLWLTKHMVEGHHGRIWVESEFGHGTTFYVWLPQDPATLDELSAGE